MILVSVSVSTLYLGFGSNLNALSRYKSNTDVYVVENILIRSLVTLDVTKVPCEIHI